MKKQASRQIDMSKLGDVWANLIAITEEMGIIMRKTAHCPEIREGSDFSAGVFDNKGQLVAQGNFSPAQLGSMPFLLKSILRDWFPPEKWAPGDCVLTNDPTLNSGHLCDIYTVVPIFFEGQLVSFVSIVCHEIDVGGAVPGSQATIEVEELVNEGIHLYPIKFYKKGEINKELSNIIAWNVRDPETLLGDLKAQRGALEHQGLVRVTKLFERYGVETMFAFYEEIMKRTEMYTRQRISELPDGEYTAVDYFDDYGPGTDPIKLKVMVKVKGDEILVDYTGTGPQVPIGTNVYFNYTRAYTVQPIKSMLTPDTPMSEGDYRAIKVIAPEGCFVNPKPTAACGGRAINGNTIASAVLSAIAPLFPDRATAAYSSLTHLSFGGRDHRTGRQIADVMLFLGGHGARACADGVENTGAHMMSNAPVEVMEVMYPIRIERFSIIPDSGGAGKYRGSPAFRKDVRCLYRESRSNVLSERVKFGPPGLAGGKPGLKTSYTLYGQDGSPPQELAGKANYHFKHGDLISVVVAGGGGYGNPLEREVALVEEDVARGYVTIDGALRDYGVEIDPKTGKGRRVRYK